MRRLLAALPFALLPLTAAFAHEAHDHEHEHEHGTLAAHEHGVAQLDVALENDDLELQFDSPAMNLVGFEHAPSTDADKAKVAAVRQQLTLPLALFSLPPAAGCSLTQHSLKSPLFAEAGAKPAAAATAPTQAHAHEHAKGEAAHEHAHSDVKAHYRLTCTQPDKLAQVDLAPLFAAFPQTQKINVQLIGPNGQKGQEATPAQATVAF